METDGDDVVRGADQGHHVETEPCDAKCRSYGTVTWPVQKVLLSCVTGRPGLDERIRAQGEEETDTDGQRNQVGERRVMPQEVHSPARHPPKQSVRHTH